MNNVLNNKSKLVQDCFAHKGQTQNIRSTSCNYVQKSSQDHGVQATLHLGFPEKAEGISGAYEHMASYSDSWLAEGGGGVVEGAVGLEQRIAGCCWSFPCTAAIC